MKTLEHIIYTDNYRKLSRVLRFGHKSSYRLQISDIIDTLKNISRHPRRSLYSYCTGILLSHLLMIDEDIHTDLLTMDFGRYMSVHIHDTLGQVRSSASQLMKIYKNMINCGYFINRQDKYGDTLLHSYTSGYDDMPDEAMVIHNLVDMGLDINISSDDGISLLMQAAYYGREICVEVLLSLGADIQKMDNEGRTVISYVCSREMRNLICSYPSSLYTNRDRSVTYMSSIYSDMCVVTV